MERQRLAQNQALFREVNERIEQLGDLAVRDGVLEVLCECGSIGCATTLRVTVAEYEDVRAHPMRFFVVPGHVYEEVERVAFECDRYAVVEKLGEPASELDPRS
jgi:hypothetical protein